MLPEAEPCPAVVGNSSEANHSLGQTDAGLSDAELAYAMQIEELEQGGHSIPATPPRTYTFMADAVWGEIYFSSKGPPAWHRAWFGCAPCCLIGCKCVRQCFANGQEVTTSMNAKRAWKQFWLTFATWLSMLQIGCLVVMLLTEKVMPLSVNIMIGPHPHTLSFAGAKNAARIRYKDEWWRLFSPLMLHSGVIHLLANMIIQLRLGVWLEIRWGHTPWLLVYFGSGIYSMLASSIFLPDTLTVGSSGAICGLIGAEFVFLLLSWRQTLPRDILERNMQVATVVITILMTAAISFAPMIDFAAHAGGLVFGALIALVLFADRMQDYSAAVRCVAKGTGFVSLVALSVCSVFYFVHNVEPERKLLYLCRQHECM